MRFCERKCAIVLNARISVPMIIIDLIGIQSLQETLEMIETMPVMASYCGTEHVWHFARVIFVLERVQQEFALVQNFCDGILQRRGCSRWR